MASDFREWVYRGLLSCYESGLGEALSQPSLQQWRRSVRGGWRPLLEWQVLIFPSTWKWHTEKPLSPSVCVFPACRQWKYDSEMLVRYRQALETAVNLSVKHSLPPLPGRTLLVYLTDANADKHCPKRNPQGVNKTQRGRLVGCWGSWEVSCLQPWFSRASKQAPEINDVHLLPSIRPWPLGTVLRLWSQACSWIIRLTFHTWLVLNLP